MTSDKKNIDAKTKRQFKIMPTLDFYILKEFLVIYFCLNAAFIVLFVASDLINKLGDFTNTSASALTIVYYFLLKQPGNIIFVLPIALLLSTIYTMARFGVNNEITAMRASGISLIRCGATLYVIGLIVTGVNFWFVSSLVPNCTREANIVHEIPRNENYLQSMTRMLVYRTPNGERTWLVKQFVSKDVQEGILVKKFDKNKKLIFEISAAKAIYSPTKGWKFLDVKLTNYEKMFLKNNYKLNSNNGKQPIITPVTTKIKVFDKSNKEFSRLGDIFETPKDFLNVKRPMEEWTSEDIRSVLKRAHGLSESTVNSYETILYSRLVFPWVCFLCVLLAIPLAVANERRGIMFSVMKAIGVVLLYQVSSQVFMVLGAEDYLPAIMAGSTPTILLAIYVWYNIYKHK